MKFIHGADFHTGYRQYGMVERASDFMLAWLAFCASAVDNDCDFVILPGDLFNYHVSDPVTISGVVTGLSMLKQRGIPVYAVKGNHEISRVASEYDWMDFLQAQHYLVLLEAGNHAEYNNCVIYGLPWSGYATDAEVAKLDITPGWFTILMLHAGMEDMMSRNHPGTLSYETLRPLMGVVNYVALGHIHKPYDNSFIMNPGSPETCSRDEAQWPERGWFIVDVAPDGSFSYNRVSFSDRRNFIVADTADYETLEWIAADGNGAVIHIKRGSDADYETISNICNPLYLRVERPKVERPSTHVVVEPEQNRDALELELLANLCDYDPFKIIELKYEIEGGIIYGKAEKIHNGDRPSPNPNGD